MVQDLKTSSSGQEYLLGHHSNCASLDLVLRLRAVGALHQKALLAVLLFIVLVVLFIVGVCPRQDPLQNRSRRNLVGLARAAEPEEYPLRNFLQPPPKYVRKRRIAWADDKNDKTSTEKS